jgi:esterase/lipase superfamily enzyme
MLHSRRRTANHVWLAGKQVERRARAMPYNVSLLLALLGVAPELQRILGDDWTPFRDEILVLAGRLEQEGDTQTLGDALNDFVRRLLKTAPPDATNAVRGAMQRAQPASATTRTTRGAARAERGGRAGRAPDKAATSEPVGTVVIPVFYGTDRASTDDPDPQNRYSGSRGSLGFGVARVSIPVDKPVGELPGPSWWRLEFRPDPSKHVVLLDVRSLAWDDFAGELRGSLASVGEMDALVFIHGYNVGFADAARRAAQIAFDLKFPGRTLLYSWASAGDAHKYTVDEATVEWSTPHFEHFLRLALTEIGARAVHVIAHSMGNRAMVRALEHFDASSLPQGAATLRQIILAAPDVDSDTFRQLAGAFNRSAERVTLYASSTDLALKVSKTVHGYPRAGDAGGALVIVDGVDTIDATNVDTSLLGLGHSYFGSKRSILNDMFNLITQGQAPDLRFDLEAAPADRGKYWLYRP